MASLITFYAQRHRTAALITFSVCALLLPALSYSADDSKTLNCIDVDSASTRFNLPPSFESDVQENTNISADSSLADKEGTSEFKGDVIVERHQLRITSDEATHNSNSNEIDISGNVNVNTINMSLTADSGKFSTLNDVTDFQNVIFSLEDNMYGKASSIKSENKNYSQMYDASITSCNLEDPDWIISAKNINLNHAEEYGSADAIILRFMDTPILYLPYIEFPLGERRRSGLLVPEISYSTQRGTEIVQPWYWNIAPNHDAIIAPHFMNRRGLAFDTRYRFLTETTTGEINSSFLAHDKVADDKRYQLQYLQKTVIKPALRLSIDIQDVSDTDYFRDFNNSLSTSSTTHLPRSAKITHATKHWSSSLLVKSYETLDTTTAAPYQTLPQILLEGDHPLTDNGLAFTLDAEWVEFDHKDEARTTGSRLSFKPGLHWLMSGASWYIDPAIHFSHTQYGVEDSSGNELIPNDRNLSISSIDAGMFFERNLDNGMIQTLEPRLYYLNVPYKDQDKLPRFDSRLSAFNSAQLFLDNRFSGNDRIGDANQITLALSSRFFNPQSGDEAARLSLGQIIYFEDRQVTLTKNIEDSRTSDYIGELSANWHDWSLSSSILWNPVIHEATRQNFLLNYQSDQQHILNLGLRTNSDTKVVTRQTDFSFMYPLNNKYSIFARWNYSLENDYDIDTIGGISYDSCCWSLQLLAQRHLINSSLTELEYDNAFMIQLVLKNLGSVSGDRVKTTLQQAILGYDEELQ